MPEQDIPAVRAYLRKRTDRELARLLAESADPLVRNYADCELWMRCTKRVHVPHYHGGMTRE